MAAVAKSGTPSLSTRNPCPGHYVGSNLLTGEAISAGDPCYVKSDGKVWRSIGTTADAAAKVDGWAAGAAASGEAVTLLTDVEFHWGSGMTPGARMYLSLTAGTLSDATTAGGTGAVAKAIDATRIRVWASTY
jgi:hypothetical protein